jgi:hypothetical protein
VLHHHHRPQMAPSISTVLDWDVCCVVDFFAQLLFMSIFGVKKKENVQTRCHSTPSLHIRSGRLLACRIKNNKQEAALAGECCTRR